MTELDRAKDVVRIIRDGALRHDAIEEAWLGRYWLTLGYPSWAAMCRAECGRLVAIPRDVRRRASAELREAGMSTRAIGTALGVDQKTVVGDLRGEERSSPSRVRGLDGKTYPGKRTVRVPPPSGSTSWSRAVETVSLKVPMADLTDDEVERLRGAAIYLRDYCTGELTLRKEADDGC